MTEIPRSLSDIIRPRPFRTAESRFSTIHWLNKGQQGRSDIQVSLIFVLEELKFCIHSLRASRVFIISNAESNSRVLAHLYPKMRQPSSRRWQCFNSNVSRLVSNCPAWADGFLAFNLCSSM